MLCDRIRCSCKSLPGMQIASGDPEASPTADAAVKRLHLQRDTKYEAQDAHVVCLVVH